MNEILRIKSVLVIGLALLAGLGCEERDTRPDEVNSTSSMAALKSHLESNEMFNKEEPFVIRSFRPYVDNTWIGNAVAYGCYREGQAPGQESPSTAELLEDLRIIARHWNMIRVYGADDDTRRILELIDKQDLPIKVILGIWLAPEVADSVENAANVNSTLLGIELANRYPNIVLAVSVGNETQVSWSGHRMRVASLLRYIRAVRQSVSVPVTTADDYLYWNKREAKRIAEEVDFIFTHIHPLWNGKTLENAVKWMDSVYRALEYMYPDRDVVLGETGWATDYDSSKSGLGEQGTLIKGEVGLGAQAAFLANVDEWIEANKVTTFLFEVFDEPWKGGGAESSPSDIEKHWGVYSEDRTPKESFTKFLNTRDTGPQ